MIRRGTDPILRLRDHLTLNQTICKHLRHKHVIEPDVWIPGRKRVSLVIRVQRAITITITGVQHQLNSLALQFATTNPDQRPNPRRQTIELQRFSGRKCIEVSNQDMKTVLMTFDPVEQRSDLARSPAFVPLRKSRAQVQPKHSSLTAGKHDFEKRVPRARGIVPLVIINLLAAEKT